MPLNTPFTAAGTKLRSERGFTFVELLFVIGILSVVLAYAAHSLGMGGQAKMTTAEANLRTAIRSAEAFHAAHLTYVGMDDRTTGMWSFDAGLAAGVSVNDPADLSDTHYCLKSVDGNETLWDRGPDGAITSAKPLGCT